MQSLTMVLVMQGPYKVIIQSMTTQETPLLCLEVAFSVSFPHFSWPAFLS